MSELKTLPVDQIKEQSGFNPRSSTDPTELERLAESIRTRGLLNPIAVRQNDDGFYVTAGHRRFAAAQMAGLREIDCLVKDEAEDEALADALIENLQRIDITLADEVRAFRRLKQDHGWNAKRIAHETGLPQGRVTRRMQLLVFPDESIDKVNGLPDKAIRNLVEVAKVSQEHAVKILEAIAKSEDAARMFGLSPVETVARIFTFGPGWKVLSTETNLRLDQVDVAAIAGEDEQLAKDVAALRSDYNGWLPVERDDLAQAVATKAGVELQDSLLVFDPETVDLLLAKALRDWVTDQRERAERHASYSPSGLPKGSVRTEEGEVLEGEEAKEYRKEKREEGLEQRVAAESYNQALYDRLAEKAAAPQVDASLMRLLCSLVLNEAGDYVVRGLRYLHPNWREVEPRKNGGEKISYPSVTECRDKLGAWVDAARTAEEVAGRTLVILLAAQYADPRAVAQSSRGGRRPTGSDRYDGQSETVQEELARLAKRYLTPRLWEQAQEVVKAVGHSYPG